MEPLLVYFSSKSKNTHRFVEQLGIRSVQIPTSLKDGIPKVREPFVLISPTYSGDDGSGAVPKQVIQFLNDPENRSYMKGVIAGGNRNFGKYYGYAGTVISNKCKVPFLYKFELMGTPEDIINVKNGVMRLWDSLGLKSALKKTGT